MPVPGKRRWPSATTLSLLGVILGFACGAVLYYTDSPFLAGVAEVVTPVGRLWVNVLRFLIMPMVVTLLLTTIVSDRKGGSTGKLGAVAMLLIVAVLLSAILFAQAVVPPLVDWLGDDIRHLETPAADASILGTELPRIDLGRNLSDWIANLVPRDPMQAAVDGNMLPMLLLTVAFAFAASRLPREQRDPLARLFRSLADATMTIVHWVLWITPVAVFSLALSLARTLGHDVLVIVIQFAVLESLICIAFGLLLYPVAVFAGGVRLRDFVRGVAPAQIVALSTRSSVASLPALMTGAREGLRLPTAASSLVLPLCVSVFKVNSMLTSMLAVYFLSEVYQIPITFERVANFMLIMTVFSFTSPGIPGGSSPARKVALYLTAGILPEGALIGEMAEVFSDMFRTVTNVTANMTVAVLATRMVATESVESRRAA